MDKFVIIDGNSLVYRAFYALPMLANFDGVISNAVFGFTNILIRIINEINPKYICVAFDHGRKTFRNDLFEDYKGTRKETPEELRPQFGILKELLQKMNIKIIEKEGFEADDIIGSLSKKFDIENIIVTGDRDAFQLINKNTTVYFTKKGISETENFTPEKLMEVYSITPSQVVELKALMGDASDNIPGVKGVGEKTGTKLINEYGSLKNVYENIDNIKGKLKERLIEDKENAFLSKELATIKTDMDLDYDLSEFVYDFPFDESVVEMFKKYQFNSLLKRPEIFKAVIESSENLNGKEIETIEIKSIDENFEKLLKLAEKHKSVALVFTDTFNFYVDGFEFVFDFNQDLLSKGLTAEEAVVALKPLLENESVKKVVFDYKHIMHVLHKYNASILGVEFDAMIARHLINNNAKSNITAEDMLLEFSYNVKNLSYGVYEISKMFKTKLKELELESLFYDMEMPLCVVLFNMEVQGFKIDRSELTNLNEKYVEMIDELTQNIHKVTGEVFNINSPKQLSEVLFNKLKLVSYNNKKNSTGIDILNQIADQHEVVNMIIEYRKITKLYNTYIKSFLELMDKKTDKIHTIFNQTITSTVRLSCVEPNLQNIPVRTEEGREFRKVFVSSFENGYIVSADYSQIELRLLASFSGDEKLIESFNNNKDIHSITASEVMGVKLEDVTPEMRRDAKAINFGIIYGISDYGLSQNINTSVATAKNYIEKYFEKYPKVKEYMDKNVADCKQSGFVKTLFGRIRNILEINSSNYNLRQFGERAAMNMPLQGSASDIIKVAMVKIFNEFNEKGLKSKLILQVHDELLVDCEPSELEIVKKTLKECMENVVDLPVKLTVNIDYGKNWSEA